MPEPQIDAIGVAVTDMARSVDFYRRLGCGFAAGEAGPHVEAELGGGVRLMLDVESLASLPRPAEGDTGLGHGAVALAARCADPAEVDRLYAEFDSEGLGRIPPFDADWGQRYAGITDPDGTHVDLYAALPG